MRSILSYAILFIFCFSIQSFAQSKISYELSFENAVHHEAIVKASFSNLPNSTFSLRMSRTSPGRYALHEFAKNIYLVKATNSKGEQLKITRPNPHQWDVHQHDGTVHFQYTLFANRGDGTYAQVDETHAHLNVPATFIFAPSLKNTPIEVTFNTRNDLNWKIATQLKHVKGTTYYAPDLQYFMDSPIELSDHQTRSFDMVSNGKTYRINFVLHHNDTDAELDEYFSKIQPIVEQQVQVFGELPDFDYKQYTFLACYIPNANSDGMEHRNSTVVTNTNPLSKTGMKYNISTVSHEFFHIWNVERIRPKSLEPFNFEEANMSGELWFAEGFTVYYTNLTLCRAGIMSQQEYIDKLGLQFKYVWNATGTSFFNPIEMSYQAPFVDAAAAIDPDNRENTYISYYPYGGALGLALDLSLRQHSRKLNLDGFMKLVWTRYGKQEIPYTIDNLHQLLKEYAGATFGDDFFNNYIYASGIPDYQTLFDAVGISLTQKGGAYLGLSEQNGIINKNVTYKSPAYTAGLEKGDRILSLNGITLSEKNTVKHILEQLSPDTEVTINYSRFGTEKTTVVRVETDPTFKLLSFEEQGLQLSRKQQKNRTSWLGKK